MEINSIKAYGCQTPRRIYNSAQQPQTEEKPSFTSRDKQTPKQPKNSAASLRKMMIPFLFIPVTSGVVASCSIDDETYAKAEAHTSIKDSIISSDTTELPKDTVRDTIFTPGDTVRDTIFTPGDTVRDTVYIYDRGVDTVYVDTGSYHHSVDTIVQWRDNFERPIPLDSIMNDLGKFGNDEAVDVDWKDPNAKRNIIHWEADREWEYNNKEIADINILQSSKRNLVYDVKVRDYKGQPIDRTKVLFRYIGSPVSVLDENGKRTNAEGYYVEVRNNKNGNANTDVIDCELLERVFVRTDGDTLRVYRKNEDNVYEYDGDAAKGYLNNNSILLKNLIGQYDTDDHLVNVKIAAVDDETLKDLYVRKRDDAEAAAEAKRR